MLFTRTFSIFSMPSFKESMEYLNTGYPDGPPCITCLLFQLLAGIDARRVGVRNHVLVEAVPEPAPHVAEHVGGHGARLAGANCVKMGLPRKIDSQKEKRS